MATNNLLVNNEARVMREVAGNLPRSKHNLSQSVKFPCEVGIIYPFFCRKTLPSDSFKINSNILIRQLQPLKVPQMTRFTVQTAFYWVDYMLAFPDFEQFMINQQGDPTLVELPYVHFPTKDNKINGPTFPKVVQSNPTSDDDYFELHRNVRSFLGFTINSCNEKSEALPFWTYQTIKRDFYTNIDRLSSSDYEDYFPKDVNKWKLRPGVNYAIGDYTIENDTITGHFFNFALLRSHDVRGDYFTNTYPTPLRGNPPTLSAEVQGSSQLAGKLSFLDNFIPSSDVNNPKIVGATSFGSNDAFNNFYVDSQMQIIDGHETAKLSAYADDNTAIPSGSKINLYAPLNLYTSSLNNYLRNSNVSIYDINAFTGNLSITTRQLRVLDAITRKQEVDILSKPRLTNYLNAHFGINHYQKEQLYQPVYIGGTTQTILINEIEQTVSTDSSPLGQQGATAMSLADNYVGDFYCSNYGCLMGVMFILPDFDYEPALPREWQEMTPNDFYNPMFSHLSMQPILNKELFVSDDSDWNNQVLGYGGAYDNYRTSVNQVAGLMLGDYEDINNFAQVRRFSNNNKPGITTSFLNSYTAFDKTAFAVPSMPPFIAQCVARVEAIRPMPEVATPRDI